LQGGHRVSPGCCWEFCAARIRHNHTALGEAVFMAGNRKLQVRRVRTGILGRALILVLLVPTLSTTGNAFPGGEPRPPAKQSTHNNAKHKNLPNFGEATTTLYHGGQPSKTGFRMLAKMGVSIVVDLRGSRDSERKIVTHLGMHYVAMPWECSFPKDKVFAEFLTLLRTNSGKTIFVHCRLGDDRTAMIIASYRMAEEGWSAEKAKLEMEKFGFSFAHRNLICPGLSSYEEKFPYEFKTSPAFRNLR
jgi:tyrosine-protein phosphatase SIW14